jgi:AmmeMemoRadiSam system protein B
MSLIFSAFVPHSPLLIPAIGKEHRVKLQETIKAYNKLEAELIKVNPETIIIISPHSLIQENVFTLNLCSSYRTNLSEFGDLVTKKEWLGDLILAQTFKDNLAGKIPLNLISQPELDYGSVIPLILLTKNLNQIKIIPLSYAGLSREKHFVFGERLRREILTNQKRIAVIASGDLSHCLTKNAPIGCRPAGKKFDKKFLTLLSEGKFKKLAEIDPNLAAEAGECGLKSALILGGILNGSTTKPKLLSYQYPFGVGYAVIQFAL